MRLGRLFTLLVPVVSVVFGTVFGTAITSDLRGYAFRRPAVFPELSDARAVRHVTPFLKMTGGEIETSNALRFMWARHERLAILRERKLSLTDPGLDPALDVGLLVQSLTSAGILTEIRRGLNGVAIEFDDGGGKPRLLLLALSKVSADRALYREVLLSRSGSGWETDRTQRFFVGEDGADTMPGPWPPIVLSAACAGVIALVLGVPATVVGILAGRAERRRRMTPVPPPLPGR